MEEEVMSKSQTLVTKGFINKLVAYGMFKRAVVTACCVGGVMVASAAASEPDQFPDIDCSKEQETTLGIKVCSGRELAKTEKELKAQRQKLLNAADKDMRNTMSKWFKASDNYADAMCQVEGQYYAGGSMQGLVVSVCLNNEYGRQLKELNDLENRPEGG
jgi:uncharacterized protein YecT (DUF1311 family)